MKHRQNGHVHVKTQRWMTIVGLVLFPQHLPDFLAKRAKKRGEIRPAFQAQNSKGKELTGNDE
jgi:hypothetical protein